MKNYNKTVLGIVVSLGLVSGSVQANPFRKLFSGMSTSLAVSGGAALMVPGVFRLSAERALDSFDDSLDHEGVTGGIFTKKNHTPEVNLIYFNLGGVHSKIDDRVGRIASQVAKERGLSSLVYGSLPFYQNPIAAATTKKNNIVFYNPFMLEDSEFSDAEIKAVLHHEVSHIINRDTDTHTVPYVIGGGIGGGVSAYKKAQKVAPHNGSNLPRFVMQNLKKIPYGWAIGLASMVPYCAYHRFVEQRADDQIPDDPQLLKGMVSVLSKMREVRENQLRCRNIPEILIGSRLLDVAIDPLHPSCSHRIDRFKERLANVEAKQKKA